MASRFAVITFMDEEDSPAFPGRPDNSLPGYTRPVDPGYGQGRPLPGGGHIATLPVFPFDPTLPSNELPGQQPGMDNSLPRPGKKYVVKWLACQGLILVPDNSLPGGSGELDNTLPDYSQPK